MFKKYFFINIAIIFFVLIKIDFAQNGFPTSINNRPSFIKNLLITKEDLSSREMWEFMRLRDPVTNSIPLNISSLERKFAKNLPTDEMIKLSKGNQIFDSNEWTLRGPYNQGGRSRAVAVDVNNPNIVLAGGTTGGMWRSTDNGQTWKKVTPPQEPIQTVTCIVQDTRAGKTNIWYYGTGEYSSNLELPDNGAGFTTFLGAGIYKSTDNGITWNRLTSTIPQISPTFINPFQIVWGIGLDKSNTNEDIVYAAIYGDVMRSSDGGTTWNSVLGNGNNAVYSSVAVTGDGDVYAALSNGNTQGVWHSANGTNWADITPANFPTVYARLLLAGAPSDSKLIYLLANTPGSGTAGSSDGGDNDFHSLWKYDAANSQWTDLSTNLPDWSGNVGGYSSQSSYDMFIKVSPVDANFVVIGGTNIYRTTDGFATKLDSTNWIGGYSPINDISSYPNHHPDQHDFYFLPSDTKKAYSAHDGGLSFTTDITANQVEWNSMNNGFSTTQFYSVALDHATANSPLIVGGLQDNGNMLDTTSGANASWVVLPYGGDGGIGAIADGGNYIYYSTQNGNIYESRVSDGSSAFIRPAGANGFLFTTPFVLDPTNTNIFYVAAGTQIWRNSDVQSLPFDNDQPTTQNWTNLTEIDTSNTISALAVSSNPAHILYYGTNNGKVFKISGSDQGNPSSQDISSQNFPQGYISSIAVDAQDADNIIVDFSNYNVISLFQSTDGGSTWTAVSGNLEQNPDGSGSGPSVRNVKILNLNGSKVYFAGTSTGLYSTAAMDGMNTTWIQQSPDGIGMVDVESIDVRNIDGTVIAGTFANGVYSTKFNITGVEENDIIPLTYSLSQNYPNPFNPATKISFELPKAGEITLKIFNTLGQEVKTLLSGKFSAGEHDVSFNAENLASGIYIYKLTAGNFTESKKMVLLK